MNLRVKARAELNSQCDGAWRRYLSQLLVRMQPSMISFSSGTFTLEKLSGLVP